MTAIPSHITTQTKPGAVGLPFDSVKRGFKDSNQPCNHALAPVGVAAVKTLLRFQSQGSELYCSLVVRGGQGKRANGEVSV
jgi:hypothetical protein